MIARFAALACLVACGPPTREGSFGALRWEIAPSDLSTEHAAIAIDPGGNVIVAWLDSRGSVTKLSGRDGTPVWSTTLVAVGPYPLQMPHVATDRDGNVLLTGLYAGSVDFGGIIATSAGQTAFVAKYAPDGVLKWVRDVGPNAQACGRGIGVGDDGSAYVTGGCDGTLALPGITVTCHGSFAARFDRDGTALWARATSIDRNLGLLEAVTADGALLLVTNGWPPTVAERIDATGATQWTAQLAHDAPTEGVAATSDGTLVATIAGQPATIVAVDPSGYGEWTTDSASGSTQLDAITVAPDGRIFTSAGPELEAYDEHGTALDVAAWPYLGDGVDLVLYGLSASSDFLAFVGTGQATGTFVGALDLR